MHFKMLIVMLTLFFSHNIDAACDFSRQDMENCFIEYHTAKKFVENDPICGQNLSRLDRVRTCIKIWEKVYLKPGVYLKPRTEPTMGTILTPHSEWNFENRCVIRKVTFLDVEHEDMLAYVFECPMKELQFAHMSSIGNFYISYGGEQNSAFYFHNVHTDLALTPKKDDCERIVIRIDHWVNNLNKVHVPI